MNKPDKQQAARDTWEWLSLWVKKNRNAQYKRKYLGKNLARRIGCHPSAISLWKHGRMAFSENIFEKILEVLDEWCSLLPKEGWLTPFHFSDENLVQHIIDYRDAAKGIKSVRCDRRCACKELTPSEGKYCMYCGREFPPDIEQMTL